MRKTVAVIFLAVASFVAASACAQTTVGVKPGGCVRLDHCILFASDNGNNGEGSTVWTEGLNFLMFNSDAQAGLGMYANRVTVYELTQAPGTNRAVTYPFTLHVVGSDTADAFTLDLTLTGYRFYKGQNGRTPGGWRYAITSGSITY